MSQEETKPPAKRSVKIVVEITTDELTIDSPTGYMEFKGVPDSKMIVRLFSYILERNHCDGKEGTCKR